jgi:hypothetical protein
MSGRLASHLHLNTSPVAHPDAVLRGDRWRITVLTDGLVRLEWSEDGAFEDRASTFALHRDLPVPEFALVDGETALEVVTDRFRLVYDRAPFSPAGLSIQARGNVSNYHSVWRYGEPLRNLGGTARTLDDVDGRIALEDGVLSRWGVALLDDSGSFLWEDDGWFSPREPGGTTTRARSPPSTPSPGRRRCCRAGRWATGGAAITATAPSPTWS